MGLVGRIGISRKIKVYVLGPTFNYKLTKKKIIKWGDHFDYPKNFKKYSKNIQKNLINEAKKNISLRLSGKKDFRYKMARPIDPVFLDKKISRKNKKNKKKKEYSNSCTLFYGRTACFRKNDI